MKTFYILLLLAFGNSYNYTQELSSANVDSIQNYSCIDSNDSKMKGETSGCQGSYYTIVDSTYLVRIYLINEPSQYGCESYKNMGKVEEFKSSIKIFKVGEANMNGVCTDLIFYGEPEAVHKTNEVTGSIKVYLGEDYDYYGLKSPLTTILIESLKFYDFYRNKEVIIKDILIWEEYDRGIPG